MYHCRIHFYLTGRPCEVFDWMEETLSSAHFTYEFVKCAGPNGSLESEPDAIFADLQMLDDAEAARLLKEAKKKGAELILLADKAQAELLAAEPEGISDIWILPMSKAEASFRILKWQKSYEAGMEMAQKQEGEEALRRRNRELESILESLECGILCHTPDGSRILHVNKTAMAVLGYASREEMEAEGFEKAGLLVPEEDRQKLWESISRLRNPGDNASVEYRMKRQDGQMRHIMENVMLMIENGEVFFRRYFLDHTAQKLQEREAAHAQMEMLQALSIDYSFVCFYDLDTGIGHPIRIHNEATNLDYQEDFPLQDGMDFYAQNIVYEEDREMFLEKASAERLEQEMSEKKIYHVRYRIVQDGEIVYFLLKAVRVGEWMGKRGIVVAFRSVDEETRNEITKNELLENALAQATNASKAKSDFLSNMSHDIRTPMNAIVGFTTLALTHIDKKDVVEDYLKKSLMSSNHLLSLINDILDMSRIESGKMRLSETPCSLSEILHGLQSLLITEAHKKGLALRMDMAGVVHEEIYCDKLRLNQVLLNLLSNSIKYTGAGGEIRLQIKETAGTLFGSASYEFFVTDTGYGMSEEFVKHIFDPFEREHNHTTSKIQGTGLGMAITKNLVDMMNGSIEVKSELNKGTQITVIFPFRLNSDGKNTENAPKAKEGVPQTPPAGKNEKGSGAKRLLLAEDNELNQEIAIAVLEDAGFLVEVADNGQIAVDMVKNSKPGYYQIVLMDVQMPVMNGYEATIKIRELEDAALSSIPIFAMTADAFEEDKRKGLNCGMNGHIAKPIDIEKLLDTLSEMMAD